MEQDRIAKVMARAGLCSRRMAESWIAAGRVTVNGKVITSPALNVSAEDVVTVDGKALPTVQETRIWLYHKPPGLVTTYRDPQGRPTVFEHLPPELPRVVSIGRLDLQTEGLLLLTNDGEVARKIELPNTGWKRHYRVRVYGHITQEVLDGLRHGLRIRDPKTKKWVQYGPVEARLEPASDKGKTARNIWIRMALAEGKNREIRNICEHLGWKVSRLVRLQYGPFKLAGLSRGDVVEVPVNMVRKHVKGL